MRELLWQRVKNENYACVLPETFGIDGGHATRACGSDAWR